MPGTGSRSAADDAAAASIELIASTLRVVDGVVLDDAQPFAAALPPTRVARGRQDEHLLFFLQPTGVASPHLCRELREIVARVYWATAGSVTAALRRAASSANRFLFEHNLNAEPSDRCYGGLSCVVIRHKDLFLLQAGPGWACILQAKKLTCLPRGASLAHLGIGPLADVRLNHVLAAVGDTLLLASPALLREAGEDGLVGVLGREDVADAMEGLEQWGSSADFTALVVRWERARTAEVSVPQDFPAEHRSEAPAPVPRPATRPHQVPEPVDEQEVPVVERTVVEPTPGDRQQPTTREPKPPKKDLVIAVWRVLRSILRGAARGLSTLWHAVAAVVSGLVALGKWLIAAIGKTIRNTLPGLDRTGGHRAHRRPPPQENRAVSIGVAIGIPLLVAGVIAVAHVKLAARSRFEGVIRQAEEHVALAQTAGVGSEEARAHWEAALEQTETAVALQPEDAAAQVLLDQVRDALDRLDGIERLTLTQLADFGSSSAERRLVLSDQGVFVLDRREGWGARVPLDSIDDGSDTQNVLVLVRIGQQVEGVGVDRLVDCAWVGREGGRQSSALLVLEEDGGVLSYDPAWGTESGAPHLTRLELSRPLPERPIALGTYEGQFYVLDAGAEDGGQIWRYRPRGNAYPEPPEPYFSEGPEMGLETAVDIAIDGHIYVLHDDGTVQKFLGGEPVPFEIQGVPGGIDEVSGIAVDSRGSGPIYVLDRGNNRLVELHPDGDFKVQFRANEVFGGLEALAVSETERRLYVLDRGLLYAASLP